LPVLLGEFVPPVFELFGDGLDAACLFDGSHFDLPGVTVAQAGVRQLHHRVCGVGIDAFTELSQDFDGVVQFSGGRCEHKSEWKATIRLTGFR
jgi:hypothetical protein